MSKKDLLLLLVLAVFAGCNGGADEEPAKVFDLSREVAWVDDTVFTLANLNEQLERMGWTEHAGLKRIGDTADFNFNALNELITERLVSGVAETISVDTVLEAQKRIREHMRGYVMQLMYADAITENVKVTPEDVESYYDSNQTKYFKPASANAAHILISNNPSFYVEEGHSHSEISKDSIDILARQKMSEVLEKLDDGEFFEDLAKEYSHDQNSGRNGGALGWIEKDQSPTEFDSVIFAIPIGETSPAVRTQHGYHVIRVYERSDSGYTPLDDQLRAAIEYQLLSEQHRTVAAAFLDSLKQVANVRFNEKLLKRDDSTYKPTDWLATVNSSDTIYVYEYSNYARTYKMKNRLPKLDVESKKEVLDGFVTVHILGVEAKKRGYYDREDAKQELADYTFQQAKHQYRLKADPPVWEPTDEEAEAFYDAHLDDYYSERPISVQHILFEDSMKAEKIRLQVEDGADFKEMALKYYPGEREIRETLFDLGYISKDEMPIEFWNAAWLLSVGDVSRPVRTQYGFHLIKMIDRKEMTTFDQASAKVKRRMKDERRDEYKERWHNDLFAGHPIVIDSALVREFVFQAPAQVEGGAPAPDTAGSSQ
ncbi:MAG: peptidylprolyl isomerase [Candidatus Zixiibacteriota bacterium]